MSIRVRGKGLLLLNPGVPDPAERFTRYAKIGCDHVEGHAVEYIGKRGDEVSVFFFGGITKID
jgi:hypothetical protein